jgi:hypothetical protein
VRIPRLLLVLVLILVDGANPLYAALGDAPQCVPPTVDQASETSEANLPIPGLRRAAGHYDPEQRDYLIRTIVFEATGEPEEGQAAVAHVVLNRIKSGRWGDEIKDVVTHPWQFEPWMTKRKEVTGLSPRDPRYRSAARIADDVIAGLRPDPTAGATHFLNPTIVRQRRGGTLPSWAQGIGQSIGNHTFYTPTMGEYPLDEGDGSTQTNWSLVSSTPEIPVARVDIFGPRNTEGDCGEGLSATLPQSPAGNLVQKGVSQGL